MKRLLAIIIQLFMASIASGVTITEDIPVPGLTDLTSTYQFTSDHEGTIIYSGSCGNGDLAVASIGSNRVTWTLAEGTYSDCAIAVNYMGENSNTLSVPSFKATNKYPVIFVHGFLSNAISWTCGGCAIDYLKAEGWEPELLIARSIGDYCEEYGGAFDCNSDHCNTVHPQIVAGWIDDVLSAYPGFERVDLIGHSRGGMNIMTGLWHGYIDPGKVRHAVTMSGSNRTDVVCFPNNPFPSIPDDETPGNVSYTIYWSNCDWVVSYGATYVGDGAFMEDLSEPVGICLDHIGIAIDAVALEAMKNALLIEDPAPLPVDDDPAPLPVDDDPAPLPVDVDPAPTTTAPSIGAAPVLPTVTTGSGGGGCFIATTF